MFVTLTEGVRYINSLVSLYLYSPCSMKAAQ
jgi:hypothetical protein